MEDNNKVANEEMKATQFGALKEQTEISELDSLIAETLNESKGSPKQKDAAKDELGLAGTKISREFVITPKKTPENLPIPQKKEVLAVEPQKQKEPQAVKSTPQDQYDKTFKTYKVGDIVKGTVVKIDQTGALVDIQYTADGFIDAIEFADKKLNVGDIINVCIVSLSNKEGNISLSIKTAEIELKWQELYDAFKHKNTIEAKVSSAVAGGLVVDHSGIRAFIPASQVVRQQGGALADFVGKTIPVKVIEIDRRQSKVIMSHRLGNVGRQQIEREKYFDQMEVGQVLHGRVSSIKKFGVFVNVNGIEGLIHINDLSWKRVDDPSKLVSINQEIDVFVIGIDKIAKKVSFGLKQLQPDPWATVSEKYKPGQTVEVKVLRLAKFGAFVELEEGIEGLIHNSELSIKGVQNPSEAVKPSDIVKAKILRIEESEQKIGLSIREIELEEQKKQLEQAQQASQTQKVTIGDTIGDSIKEQLSNQNELSQPS